jgi:hypothetical protein
MLLLMIIVPVLLAGQSEAVDSASNNFVTNDTVIAENILKTPELQVEKLPATPMIPMPVPEMSELRYPNLLMLPKYPGYESVRSTLKYTESKYDAKMLNLNFPAWTDFHSPPYINTFNLNLNFSPSKSLLDLINENPLRVLLMLVGMMNNNVVGEDKMNQIRLNDMVQSRSRIPETAISGNGAVYYEIDIKRKKY